MKVERWPGRDCTIQVMLLLISSSGKKIAPRVSSSPKQMTEQNVG